MWRLAEILIALNALGGVTTFVVRWRRRVQRQADRLLRRPLPPQEKP